MSPGADIGARQSSAGSKAPIIPILAIYFSALLVQPLVTAIILKINATTWACRRQYLAHVRVSCDLVVPILRDSTQ
jgi:hypothetical protein